MPQSILIRHNYISKKYCNIFVNFYTCVSVLILPGIAALC